MNTGAWVPACLLLTAVAGASAGTIPADVYPMKGDRFEIPIKVDPARRGDILTIELYISNDQGKTWSQRGSVPPDTPAFPFIAQADGNYWFSIVVVDKNNRKEPPDIYTAPVGMKILIDTRKPDVRLKTERHDDNVTVRWDVVEEYPDLNKFRLEWKAVEGKGAWTPVPTTPGLNGQATVRSPEAVAVRLTFEDAAGNQTISEAKAAAASGVVTVSAAGSSPTAPPMASADAVAPPQLPLSPKPAESNITSVIPLPSTPAPKTNAEELSGPPTGLPTPITTPESKSVSAPASNVVASSPITPPAREAAIPAPDLTLPKPTAPTTTTTTTPALPETPASSVSRDVPVSNNRRVSMEYEVVKVGPSGVGGVDLYITTDDGLTWKPIQGEHQSAAGGETTPGVMRRTISVELPQDGSYGFYLVVKSGAGLSQPAPRGGDTPHMRVKLDTRLPFAELYKPEQNLNQKEALLLKWKATDDNLTATPITIQWAPNSTGPWTTIGTEQMANTGSYSWVIPHGIPPSVYLKLRVRDTAGNENIAETPQPVLIDLIRPVIGTIKYVPR